MTRECFLQLPSHFCPLLSPTNFKVQSRKGRVGGFDLIGKSYRQVCAEVVPQALLQICRPCLDRLRHLVLGLFELFKDTVVLLHLVFGLAGCFLEELAL